MKIDLVFWLLITVVVRSEMHREDRVSPIDRIPPYNMLHYGGPEPYFARE